MLRVAFASVLTGSLALVGGVAGTSPGAASTMPSGQVMYGDSSFDSTSGHFVGGGGTIEPAYNGDDGSLIFLRTPNGTQVNPATKIDPATGMPRNVAPIYLPVYPVGSGIDPATLNCAHVPADNCPDHGPFISTTLETNFPAVYGAGVLGHDHLVGVPTTGGDWNVLWEPVLIVFTSVDAAIGNHFTTIQQIKDAETLGEVFEIPLPAATFHCSRTSASAYANGTPAPTVAGP
jgi:hypothetical protein